MRTQKTCHRDHPHARCSRRRSAVAQTTVEQTIQIMPGGGGGGAIQMPGMMGGPRTVQDRHRPDPRPRVASDGAGPIRRAQVRISGPDVAPKAALTDAEGRFEFRELPAGRFTLQATKSGFVNVQYGQTRPFESGKPIELADKQALDNADISMPRGSVIAGRHRRRVRRRDARRLGHGDAADVAERPPPAGAVAGPRRADQRPRTVPDLRPAARRLLRQRDAARRRRSR